MHRLSLAKLAMVTLLLGACGESEPEPVPVRPASLADLTGPWRPVPFQLDPEIRSRVEQGCRRDLQMPPGSSAAVIDARGAGVVTVPRGNRGLTWTHGCCRDGRSRCSRARSDRPTAGSDQREHPHQNDDVVTVHLPLQDHSQDRPYHQMTRLGARCYVTPRVAVRSLLTRIDCAERAPEESPRATTK